MKKSLALVVMSCVFVLALGLAACGSSSSSAASGGASASASESSSASTSVSASASESSSASTSVSASASDSSSASASASTSSSYSSNADDAAKAEYDCAVALFDEGKFYSAKAAFEKSAYEDWEQRAAACVQPMPETGELFHDEGMTSDQMILAFNVNAQDENKGIYITVYTKDGRLVESVFVKGSGTVETGIPGGEYYVKDSTGTEWYGTDEQFGPDGYYEDMVFNEVEGDSRLTSLEEGYRWDITINSETADGQSVDSEESTWENRA